MQNSLDLNVVAD